MDLNLVAAKNNGSIYKNPESISSTSNPSTKKKTISTKKNKRNKRNKVISILYSCMQVSMSTL